jgi:exodeoxyribonuclease-5
MRQAQESEIIRLTMDIRNGKPLSLFKGNEVQVIDTKDIIGGMYGWADQIIVAKNATRRNINSRMRTMLFGVEDEVPVEGDKIICLRNAWETVTEAGDVLVNGTIGTISNIHYNKYHPFLKPQMTANFISDDYTELDIQASSLDVYFRDLNIDYKLLTTGEPTVTEKNFRRFPKQFRPLTFDYGYCITCHKAQGSEYNKVLVFEEYLKGNDHARWLYTAATRAKERLVIVKDFK